MQQKIDRFFSPNTMVRGRVPNADIKLHNGIGLFFAQYNTAYTLLIAQYLIRKILDF